MARTPICPVCRAPMVKRTNRRTGKDFWGCSMFPNCRGTRITDEQIANLENRMWGFQDDEADLWTDFGGSFDND